jgi:hypothetical protein
MKTHCLLRRNQYHTTAWITPKATELGLLIEIPELGGRWEIVEIYPYQLTDKQLKTRRTLIVRNRKSSEARPLSGRAHRFILSAAVEPL